MGLRPVRGYLRSRWALHRRFDARGLPLLDLANIRQPLNLVCTSRAFQPAVEGFDQSHRFVGPSIGARPVDPSFPADRLRDPVLFASLGPSPANVLARRFVPQPEVPARAALFISPMVR